MTALIISAIIILLAIVVVQIGKVTELSAKIRGEEEIELRNNKLQGRAFFAFMIFFLIACIVTSFMYKNWMLGYGPHESASEHGGILDNMFNWTLVFTGIVFVLTHIALFWFSWKYHGKKGQSASFISHNNTLELFWSAIPAVVMTFLVVKGLIAWNEVMADVEPGEDYIEIEATGYQFAWHLRYPGPDGVLGERDFRQITGLNPLGQVWTDDANLDDIHPTEIVLPVNKKVRVRITSRDVLHNFYLPHFRVKMDAVPGLPTYFVFTPSKTTAEYREQLSEYPEYNVPQDPEDPDSRMKWEAFNFELACAELCGESHFSMRRIVRIVSEEEYEDWLSQQSSYYMSSIRGTDQDPRRGEVLGMEIDQRREDFMTEVESALASTSAEEEDLTFTLQYIDFEPASSTLTEYSRYEIDNLVTFLNQYPSVQIEIGGYTGDTGDAAADRELASQRAQAVRDRLVELGISSDRLTAVGYGTAQPAEGEAEEAPDRTTFKIIAQ